MMPVPKFDEINQTVTIGTHECSFKNKLNFFNHLWNWTIGKISNNQWKVISIQGRQIYVLNKDIDRAKEIDQIAKRALPQLTARVDSSSVSESSEGPSIAEDRLIFAERKTRIRDRAQHVGNKTANLEMLRDITASIPDVCIPEFQAIPNKEIQEFLYVKFPELPRLWQNFVERYRAGQTIEDCKDVLETISVGIEKAFEEFEHPALAEMAEKGCRLMVRSTGKEDSEELSNQGGNLSKSNVLPDVISLKAAVGEVIASYYSAHSLTQRQSVADDITSEPFMPVLLQVMAGEKPGEAIPTSGVMFTADQLNTPGVVEINSTFGHAEAVVTGSRPVDRFFVQRGFVHQIGAYGKSSRLAPAESGGLISAENPPEFKMKYSLTKQKAQRLAEIGKFIESEYGYPVDIEWSYDPSTDKFSIFQARPIPKKPPLSLTYVDPERYSEFKKMHPVGIIGGGKGSVLNLTESNSLVVTTVTKETIARYEDCKKRGIKIEAIIVKMPVASISHEAGFFREQGVALVHAGGEEKFSNVSLAIRSQKAILDVQEGFIGELDSEAVIDDLVIGGLRRHLVPKEEGYSDDSFEPEEYRAFIEEINLEQAKSIREDLGRIEQNTYGRNLLDKYVHCYENAETLENKAYFLSKIIKITLKELKEAPVSSRKLILYKIISNAKQLWEISKSSEIENKKLQEKYAISWLLTAVAEEKAEGIIGGDTLYSLIGEKKEREIARLEGGLTELDSDKKEYLDIFSRSKKFIFDPIKQQKWVEFCGQLNLEELKSMAQIFSQLGPRLVPYWLNKFTIDIEGASSTEILRKINQEFASDSVVTTLQICQHAQDKIRDFRDSIKDFSNPQTFSKALERLQQELDPLAHEVIRKMKGASGLSASLLGQTFLEFVGAYDESIKALTSSSFFPTPREKADCFAQILECYQALALDSMEPEILSGNDALIKQASIQRPFLTRHFSDLKTKAVTKPEHIIQPSESFVVANASLGSCIGDPYRMPPNTYEDYFTLLHQNMLTIGSHVIQKKGDGLRIEDLPPSVGGLCNFIADINLENEDRSPELQSIEYNYPDVKITYNCPLNFHSSSFSIHLKMGRGEIKSIKFEGKFFVSLSSIGAYGRAESLFLYAASTYYGPNAMLKPKDFELKFQQDTPIFEWEVPIDAEGQDIFIGKAHGHLSRMINYLQKCIFLDNTSPGLIYAYPIFYQYIGPREVDKPIYMTKALEGILANPTKENLQFFVKYYMKFTYGGNRESAEKYKQVAWKLLEVDWIWESDNLVRLLGIFGGLSSLTIDEKQRLKDKFLENFEGLRFEKKSNFLFSNYSDSFSNIDRIIGDEYYERILDQVLESSTTENLDALLKRQLFFSISPKFLEKYKSVAIKLLDSSEIWEDSNKIKKILEVFAWLDESFEPFPSYPTPKFRPSEKLDDSIKERLKAKIIESGEKSNFHQEDRLVIQYRDHFLRGPIQP